MKRTNDFENDKEKTVEFEFVGSRPKEPPQGSGARLRLTPVRFDGTEIHIDSAAVISLFGAGRDKAVFDGVMLLGEREPSVFVFEDGVKTREYRLGVEKNEDLSGKYLIVTVRLVIGEETGVPSARIEGVVSDSPEKNRTDFDEIVYRFEPVYLACGGKLSSEMYASLRGMGVGKKGLGYPTHITPFAKRLVGICADCGESFTFFTYDYSLSLSDFAYSDDGLDIVLIPEKPGVTIADDGSLIVLGERADKEKWKCEAGGKTFRYYNSFSCPHCGAPYIDYKKYPGEKSSDSLGCVHMGRLPYETDETIYI